MAHRGAAQTFDGAQFRRPGPTTERTCAHALDGRIGRVRRLLHLLLSVVLTAFAVLHGGCGRDSSTSSTANTARVLGAEHRFEITVGEQKVHMRLAVHDSERSRGLMEVTTMPEMEGMLFVWPKPQPMSFYMRNTKLPLDIGFFDAAGVLREIYPMYPGVEDSVVSRSNQLQLALEMNQGWFAQHHVGVGATIDLAAVREGLRQRGYDPGKFFGVR
jgi:uncharacterized protein